MLSLYLWVAFHWIIVLVSVLYAFITYAMQNYMYDMCYLVFMFGIFYGWLIWNGECLVSYFEKQQVDPTYKLGQCTSRFHFPYWLTHSEEFNSNVIFLCSTLTHINVFIVVFRQSWSLQLRICVFLLSIIPSFVMFFRPNKQDCDRLEKSISKIQ